MRLTYFKENRLNHLRNLSLSLDFFRPLDTFFYFFLLQPKYFELAEKINMV